MAKQKVNKGQPISRKDCLEIGAEALASFTNDELHDYVNQIYAKAATYTDVRGQEAIKRAMDEVNKGKSADLFNQCRLAASNIASYDLLNSKIQSKKFTLRNLLVSRGKNQADNIRQSQQAAKGYISKPVFDGITEEEQAFLINKNNDKDIYNALNKKAASPLAKKIAERVENYRQLRNAESIRTGVLSIENTSDYKYLDHMHDRTAIINGGRTLAQRAKDLLNRVKQTVDAKTKWVEYVLQRLDPENPINGAFLADKNGVIDQTKLRQVVEDIFDNITTNKNKVTTQSLVANNREAIANKKRLRLNFKDWNAWGEYNNIYGHQALFPSLMGDIMGSGSQIGAADLFGSSPASMYMDLAEAQRKVGYKKSILSPDLWNHHNDITFLNLMGANQTAVSPGLAAFRANLTALTSTKNLILLPLRSLNDLATGMSYLGRIGHNEFRTMGTMLANLFNNPIGKELDPSRVAFAKKMKLMCDSHLGYIAKALDAQTFGTYMNRLSSKVFNLNFMEPFDGGNKVSVMHLMSKDFAEASHLSWVGLPDKMRSMLENHNMTEDEWNLLRAKNDSGLFTPDNVDRISNDELRNLNNNVPLLNRRSDLYRKVYSIFSVGSENMQLNPDEFIKALFLQGTKPGTISGEFLRMVSQFKMYPITYFDRVWHQGLSQVDGMYPKLAFAIRTLAATMPLSYLSVWMDNASKGKTMPDPSQMTFQEKEKYYISLAAAGAGMFLGLMDERNENKALWYSLLRSPSLDFIGDSLSTVAASVGLNEKKVNSELKNVGKDIAPVDTIPFASPFIRKMLQQKPYLSSGQQQIYGA